MSKRKAIVCEMYHLNRRVVVRSRRGFVVSHNPLDNAVECSFDDSGDVEVVDVPDGKTFPITDTEENDIAAVLVEMEESGFTTADILSVIRLGKIELDRLQARAAWLKRTQGP